MTKNGEDRSEIGAADPLGVVIERVLTEAYSKAADEKMTLEAGTVSCLVNELKTLRFIQATANPRAEAAEGRVKVLEEKAGLWDLLMGSAEFRHVGSAGLTPDSHNWESNYGHLGLALTTHRGPNETSPDPTPRGRELLMIFLKKRAALAAAEAGEGRK